MYKFCRSMNIISSSKFCASSFPAFKFWRLQFSTTSFFPSSDFGYSNQVAAHSTFHALKLPRLMASLSESKGNHGGQGIPHRWGGAGELWKLAPERSMNIIPSSNFPPSNFGVFKFWRLQNFALQNFRLQILSPTNFRFIFRLQILEV